MFINYSFKFWRAVTFFVPNAASITPGITITRHVDVLLFPGVIGTEVATWTLGFGKNNRATMAEMMTASPVTKNGAGKPPA